MKLVHVISDAFFYSSEDVKRCLYSFATIQNPTTFQRRMNEFFKYGGETVIIDSGAYSVWKRGATIDIDLYCKFCKYILKFARGNVQFISLDVIPGEWGKGVTTDPEECAKKGLSNLDYMIKRGIPASNIIHAYHQGEPEWIIQEILYREVETIGVSPANDRTTEQKCMWLDATFPRIPKGIKTHGLGMTQVGMMARYPWHSVDSVTPVRGAAYGYCFFTPKDDNPLKAYKVCLSKQAVTLSKVGWHYDKLSEDLKREIFKYIKRKGFSFKAVRTRFASRALFNVKYFNDVEAYINTGKFKRPQYARVLG